MYLLYYQNNLLLSMTSFNYTHGGITSSNITRGVIKRVTIHELTELRKTIVGKWTALGLCRKNLWTEPNYQKKQVKNLRFVFQKYLYEKNVFWDPGNLKKRGLRRWFFCIEKIWYVKWGFFPHFCGKWDLSMQKSRIDPAVDFLTRLIR